VLKGKKVLVFGLGVLGGGVGTVNWLLKQKAKITVTDKRTKEELATSLRGLGNSRKKIKFVLGRHDKKDIERADLIVANPAVPYNNEFLNYARRKKIPVVNDLHIFLENFPNTITAITGTRGKTTTTNWLAHFLKIKDKKIKAAGNSSDTSLLKLLSETKGKTPAVIELSSFQLEFLEHPKRSPDLAIITNLYRDHLNRHSTMHSYALAKANIFKNQNANQNLILNDRNIFTKKFLKLRNINQVWYFSDKPLNGKKPGLFSNKGKIFFRERSGKKIIILNSSQWKKFSTEWGEHNAQNLLASMLGAHLLGLRWAEIKKQISTLPAIPYREEVIFQNKKFKLINDSAGTSPDATVAALKRFPNRNTLLLTGGTDKQLDFKELAETIYRTLPPHRLFLLEGSATKKLMAALHKKKYNGSKPFRTFSDLESMLDAAKIGAGKIKSSVVVFSPGSASFEKFKNEFDRGQKFNKLAKKIFLN
jgi:UDP-N-acetylmuramoylalanine--D-glutamate ligase